MNAHAYAYILNNANIFSVKWSKVGTICTMYVSKFKKRGHFGPDLNFAILICTEIKENQLSFTACFMFIATWTDILSVFI